MPASSSPFRSRCRPTSSPKPNEIAKLRRSCGVSTNHLMPNLIPYRLDQLQIFAKEDPTCGTDAPVGPNRAWYRRAVTHAHPHYSLVNPFSPHKFHSQKKIPPARAAAGKKSDLLLRKFRRVSSGRFRWKERRGLQGRGNGRCWRRGGGGRSGCRGRGRIRR